jgi:phenylalanyl-tRNA synthetase beta chain
MTTDVLLESAYFAPGSIRRTARDLGMSTEASYRFERGADYEAAVRACDRAASLIAEVAGGEVLAGIVDVYPRPLQREAILFRRDRYRDVTGLEIELSVADRILRSLGFTVETGTEGGALRATPPSWRVDSAIEVDLIEEVVRIAGYDRLQMTLPGGAGAGAYLIGEGGRRASRRALTAMGYHEAISFSFVNAEADALFSGARDARELVLRNPIDETQGQMRTTLLAGLLLAILITGRVRCVSSSWANVSRLGTGAARLRANCSGWQPPGRATKGTGNGRLSASISTISKGPSRPSARPWGCRAANLRRLKRSAICIRAGLR